MADKASRFQTYEFSFGNLKFFWVKASGFCKDRGVATSVNVVLDPVSEVRNYITYAEDSGKFCKQSFDICRPIWEFA